MNSHNLTALISKQLKEIISPADCVLLAVSGGSDSMAMLHLFCQIIPVTQITVGFVDHGLRGGVEAEWQLVKKQCDCLGVNANKYVITDSYDDSVYKGGIQQWAREHRYRLLESGAIASQCSHIATGHTLDDQAETVLLRILRGTGLDGLSAVPAERTLASNVKIIRPLLRISRNQLKNWLTNQNIQWATDPSNENDCYTRVRVRNILPDMADINPQIKNHLCVLAREADAATNWMEEKLVEEKHIKTICYADGLKVEHDTFARLPKELWGRVVRQVLSRCKGNLRRVERVHVDSIVSGLGKTNGTRSYEVPGQLDIRIAYGDLYIFPNALPTENIIKEQKIELGSSNAIVGASNRVMGMLKIDILDTELAKRIDSLVVRSPIPGDKLCGRKRLVNKLLAEKRVPSFYRSMVPVLATEENEVISIPRLLKSQVSGLRIEWTLQPNCELLDLRQFM